MSLISAGTHGINNIPFLYDYDKLKVKVQNCKNVLHSCANLSLFSDTVLLDAYSSATIEGARTTVENVKRVLNNPKTKSDIMVVNTFTVLNSIYNGLDITDSTIRSLWEIFVHNVCENTDKKGIKYRNGSVYIGNNLGEIVHMPPDCYLVQGFMNTLFNLIYSDDDIDSIIKSIICHFYFVYIHPFCDGNGRMARVLQNYVLYKNGYKGVCHISISNTISLHLGKYYKSLQACEELINYNDNLCYNLTSFIDYMLDCIIEACDIAKHKQYNLNDLEYKLLSKMSKHGVGSSTSVKATCKLLKIDEPKARYILNKLVDNDFMLKRKDVLNNKVEYILKVYVK